jgi:hypothetical protein
VELGCHDASMPENSNGIVVVGECRHAKVMCECEGAERGVLAMVAVEEGEIAPMITWTHIGKRTSDSWMLHALDQRVLSADVHSALKI